MKAVSVYMESNPNPNSLKFVVNFDIAPQGESFDYPDLKSASNAPLAQALFKEFDFVERVFFMSNFVTITKQSDTEWFDVQNLIRDFISQYLRDEKPVLEGEVVSQAEEVDRDEQVDELELKIRAVLDEYVKPAVEMDGGAITYDSFDEGTLKVQLQGSCSGCPSSMVTLKSGIENLMKRMVPEVQTVEAIEG